MSSPICPSHFPAPLQPAADVDAESEPPATCAACGAAVSGKFCSSCGREHDAQQGDSLRAFVGDAVVTIASADGRAFRTFRDLLTKPGVLTAEYAAGHRARYVSPLQLFLWCNIIFFVLGAFSDVHVLTTPLSSQFCCQNYSISVVQPLVTKRLTAIRAEHPVAGEDSLDYTVEVARFAASFNASSEQYARTLVILLVPMMALLVAALALGRGSAVHHLVFSLHFYAFALLLYAATSLTYDAVYAISGYGLGDRQVAPFVITAQAVYLAIAFRRAYGDGIVRGIVKGVLASAGTGILLTLYRLFLFLAAFHAS